MSFFKRFGIWTVVSVSFAIAAGCSGKNAPDAAMTQSPTGLWIGKADSGTSVDIQSGGQFKLTEGGRETLGTWAEPTPGQLNVTLNGDSFEVPYSRRDLDLKLTLPGKSAPTEFEQM